MAVAAAVAKVNCLISGLILCTMCLLMLLFVKLLVDENTARILWGPTCYKFTYIMV